MSSKDLINKLIEPSGVKINGSNPWDIQVHDERFYARVLKDNELGLGESYMDGWWDCEELDEMFYRLLRSGIDRKINHNYRLKMQFLLHYLLNYQTKSRSLEVAKKHYDAGNELYRAMLGETMVYSGGYWKGTDNLEDAQLNKMKLICKKLMLEPGMKLLDIGCGWGTMACYLAKNYGVEVVGITISEQQKKVAEERCKNLSVEIRLQDYRDLGEQKFDRIVSIGMYEHVGYKNYRTYMEVVKRCLVDDGLFLLQTIANNYTHVTGDPWLNKYVFPNGMLPSVTQIGEAIEGLLILEDWHNLSVNYDKTLMAWYQNFVLHWPKLKALYDQRFYRMWTYYLLYCAGAFRARKIQLWQIALSPSGLKDGFKARDI